MIKILLYFSRFFVGILFIFSGLIKGNDPLGFSYKLEEYFEKFSEILKEENLIFVSGIMDFFANFSLSLAIIIVIAEIALGVLLITGSYIKKVAWLSLLLIVFFTFLTFVSWKFELVKSCGCFGDAIPLTPYQSFIKDLILLIFIVFIFINRKNIEPLLDKNYNLIALFCSVGVSFIFTWYCYQHLPVKDFLAYAKGKRLLPQMEVVKGNPLTLYVFKDKSTGEEVKFKNYPVDYDNWEYISFENISGELTLLEIERKGVENNFVLKIPSKYTNEWKIVSTTSEMYTPDIEPKIQQLSAQALDGSETDYILDILNDSTYQFLLVIRQLKSLGNFEKTNMGLKFIANSKGEKLLEQIKELYSQAKKEDVKFYALCSEGDFEKIKSFKMENNFDFPIYSSDDTELKTMIRSSPGLFFMQGDSVIQKWHHNDFPRFKKVKNKYLNL